MMEQDNKPYETVPPARDETTHAAPAGLEAHGGAPETAPQGRRTLDIWPPIEAIDEVETGHIWPAVRQFPPEAAPGPAWPEAPVAAEIAEPAAEAWGARHEAVASEPAWPDVAAEAPVEAPVAEPVAEAWGARHEAVASEPVWPDVAAETSVEAEIAEPVAEVWGARREAVASEPAWPDAAAEAPMVAVEARQEVEALGAEPAGPDVVAEAPVVAAELRESAAPVWVAAEAGARPLVIPPLPAPLPGVAGLAPAEPWRLAAPDIRPVSMPEPEAASEEAPEMALDGGAEEPAQAPEAEPRDAGAYLSALGTALRPAFSAMVARIPKLTYAVLCTPDGFNVCSTGVSNEQIGKMAAVSSSLLAVGEALVNAATGQTELDVLTMESQGVQIVSTRVSGGGHSVILLICARTPLGVILVNAKSAVPELRARMETVA
ncbi:hypothetical protein [Acidocella sp.]|uniref:roadblock/LC7 domain-containing protein n=1 Tax=Acidocella sp. TaxID=50710 RepID=UPI002603489D|nr:hypothetical protein [Acidocella sp.]